LDLENLVTKRITFPATKINTIVSWKLPNKSWNEMFDHITHFY
jgi:hypothetical protein